MFLPLLIAVLVSTSSGLFFTMENRRHYCFYRTLNKSENLEITYIVSGTGQKNVAMKIYEIVSSIKIDLLYTQSDNSEFSYVYTPMKETQEVKICFENTDSNQKVSFNNNLQFEFALKSEKTQDLATKSDMAGLLLELKRGQRKLQKIKCVMKHMLKVSPIIIISLMKKGLEITEFRVKWASIIKISILIILCIAQIYFLTGFFKNTSTGNV